MAQVEIHEEVSLQNPTLIEGLLGVGLVGKIATDHVIGELDMTYFGSVRCPGLPRVTVYEGGDSQTYPPVRLYASEDHDLVAMRSEVPVSPSEVADFATCVTSWLEDENGTAVYVSGFPAEVEPEGDRELYGIATAPAERLLDDCNIDPPTTDGVWSGPTGALLARAREAEVGAVGLLVETDSQFPDPEAACAFINYGVNPIVGVDVDDSSLREHAEDIRREKEQLALQMGQSGDDSSRAEPTGMFQ